MLIPLIRKSLVFTVAVPIQTFPVPVEPVYPEDGVVFLTSEAVPELEKVIVELFQPEYVLTFVPPEVPAPQPSLKIVVCPHPTFNTKTKRGSKRSRKNFAEN